MNIDQYNQLPERIRKHLELTVEGELILNLEGMTFQFLMQDCHEQKNGFCPIAKGSCDECYCNDLKKYLDDSPNVLYLPELGYYENCNHFSCEGQHRTCIAGKTTKRIKVAHVSKYCGDKCPVCHPSEIKTGTDCVMPSIRN